LVALCYQGKFSFFKTAENSRLFDTLEGLLQEKNSTSQQGLKKKILHKNRFLHKNAQIFKNAFSN
jgi:hypothetical protein